MMTLDQSAEEVSQLPPAKRVELLDRLTLRLHHAMDPVVDKAWEREYQRRLAELESGQVQGIPGEEVSRRVRQIIGR